MDDIKALIGKMTLEEKAGLCSGSDFWHTKAVERLAVPAVMVSDGPHGLRKQEEGADHLGIHDSIKAVCFPAACATACSFDRTLLREMGSALGKECARRALPFCWDLPSTSSVRRCAGATLSIFPKILFLRASLPVPLFRACRVRGRG